MTAYFNPHTGKLETPEDPAVWLCRMIITACACAWGIIIIAFIVLALVC